MNLVEVNRYKLGGGDTQAVGNLRLPCKMMPCEDTCKEAMGQDILLMSFADSLGKEVMTIRKKGAGCQVACCVQKCCACPACGCSCKGCGMDGCCGKLGFSTQMDETFNVFGPMDEEARDPKAVLRLVWRRGLVYGADFKPVKFSVEPRGDVKDENLLLLIGFAYGMCWQAKYAPLVPFPDLLGTLSIPGLGPTDRE